MIIISHLLTGIRHYIVYLGNPALVSDPFCLHRIEGPIEEIFGSDDGFALFLNGMGFNKNTCAQTFFWKKVPPVQP